MSMREPGSYVCADIFVTGLGIRTSRTMMALSSEPEATSEPTESITPILFRCPEYCLIFCFVEVSYIVRSPRRLPQAIVEP